MTVILGIDTATTGCAAAIVRDEDCLAMACARMARGQSEALMPMIAEVMQQAGLGFGDLDGLAVTRGPGAFTGLRIGLAAARALALTIARPCLGIVTFDILVRQALDDSLIEDMEALVVAVDSKREELFIQVYEPDGSAQNGPAVLRPDDVAGLLAGRSRIAVAGDAGDKVASALRQDFDVRHLAGIDVPDPRVVARLGLEWLQKSGEYPPTPLYLRPPDVSPPNP
ncbi:MAG: tRNA (adenosine(37)-N6)-threonylcarbamoyltransferase complex dimerization subunit type 1 TsaB [Rhodospirillales bacterium]